MEAKSISIIGGADGPTSIYIATSINWPLLIIVGVMLVLAIVGLIIWKKKH